MATFDFPDILCPNGTEWGLITNTAMYTSPLTGAVQTAGRRGSRWFTRLTYNNIDTDLKRFLQTHIALLHGQEHRSNLFDWSYQAPYGAGGGANVNGAGQTGDTLTIFPSAGWAVEGDYFLINGELKMVTDAQVGGNPSVVRFSPPLRQSPPDGALLDQTLPLRIPMIMVGDSASWSNQPDRDINNSSSFSLEFIEDIN